MNGCTNGQLGCDERGDTPVPVGHRRVDGSDTIIAVPDKEGRGAGIRRGICGLRRVDASLWEIRNVDQCEYKEFKRLDFQQAFIAAGQVIAGGLLGVNLDVLAVVVWLCIGMLVVAVTSVMVLVFVLLGAKCTIPSAGGVFIPHGQML